MQNMSGQITTNACVLQILVDRLFQPTTKKNTARAAQHVIDWLGCATLGVRHPAAAAFAAVAKAVPNGACTTLLDTRGDWWSALLINAAVGNLLEMDDLHRASILHPGPVIVPAAIAVAEMTDATGEELLTAIVRGYEATIRIGQALGTTHYRYFHNTSTCGAFGAAAAASYLLKLNQQETVWALANAGSRTGGLWQMRHEAGETKSLHNASAAQTGVQAALLAKHGARGPSALLEGEQGIFAAMSDGADAQKVIENLDYPWRIHEVSFKPWPACRHAHPAIDAALAVAALPPFNAANIESVEIATYRSAIDFCDQPNPRTELQAKFSLQHCAAVVFCRGKPAMDNFADARINDADVVAMRARIRVIEDAAMSTQFPQHYAARLSVTMQSGEVLTHHQADAWGDPELPLSSEAIASKAASLLVFSGMGLAEADRLIAVTLALPTAESVRVWAAMWNNIDSAYPQ